jgi:hypothetical protein
VFEDFNLIPQDGNPLAAGKPTLADTSCGFSGPYLNIRGSGRVKNLTLDMKNKLRGNNQLPVTLGTGSALTPCVLQLESAASQVDTLHWNDGTLDDISSSGTKIVGVRNAGVCQVAYINGVRQLAGDAFWRQLTNSTNTTQINMVDCDVDATYLIATDVAFAVAKLNNVRVRTGSGIHIGTSSGTYRVDATGCTFDARFIRNATGNNTIIALFWDGLTYRRWNASVAAGTGLLAANDLSDLNSIVTARTNLGVNKEYIPLRVTTLVGSNVYRVICKYAGTVTRVDSITEGVLTTGDATLQSKLNGSNIGSTTTGLITITQSGSAAGDKDSASPLTTNITVAVGDELSLTVGGTNATATVANCWFEVTRT